MDRHSQRHQMTVGPVGRSIVPTDGLSASERGVQPLRKFR
jgi:hypothetical protein